jgi:hypothetical protein
MARIATARARRRERRDSASHQEGEFFWHRHHEDEFRVDLEGCDFVTLGSGDLFVVPEDLRHQPVAHEPPMRSSSSVETKRYGDAGRTDHRGSGTGDQRRCNARHGCGLRAP